MSSTSRLATGDKKGTQAFHARTGPRDLTPRGEKLSRAPAHGLVTAAVRGQPLLLVDRKGPPIELPGGLLDLFVHGFFQMLDVGELSPTVRLTDTETVRVSDMGSTPFLARFGLISCPVPLSAQPTIL